MGVTVGMGTPGGTLRAPPAERPGPVSQGEPGGGIAPAGTLRAPPPERPVLGGTGRLRLPTSGGGAGGGGGTGGGVHTGGTYGVFQCSPPIGARGRPAGIGGGDAN